MTGEDAANQVKATLTGMASDLTIDDAIALATEKVTQMIGSMFGGEKNAPESQSVEQYQSAAPGAELEGEGESSESEEPQMELNYASIVGMIMNVAEMKVNDAIAALNKVESFDISTETDPVIAEMTGLKAAVKCNLTVTCDARLNPTKVDLTASIDSSKLPADMQEEGESQNFTLTVSAEITPSVEVAPSAALQAKINEVKEERAKVPAATVESQPN